METRKAMWFNERKFGIFVHYGLYSQIERGEWTMYQEQIPCEEYQKLAETFDPSKFDAMRLARQAKEAGAGYMVFTTNHHEGFCLFQTQYSEFNSVRYTGRDLVAEYIDACRACDLKIGLYYSLLDWRYKGYHDRKQFPDSLKAMVQQAHDQIRELMTNYGKIDYLFFDGGWFPDVIPTDNEKSARIAELWRAKELISMIRSLQPEILVNDRSGFSGDVLTPEQKTEAAKDERLTEACMTIGDRWGWGYIHNNPNLKSTRCILQHMIIQASYGGNFLLNIGPTPQGTIRDCEQHILSELGQWLRTNGASVYATAAAPESIKSIVGECTAKKDCLYLHIFRWPDCGEAVVSGVYRKVRTVRLLENGKEFPFVQTSTGRLIIQAIPYLAPDSKDTVFAIELAQEDISACKEEYGLL